MGFFDSDDDDDRKPPLPFRTSDLVAVLQKKNPRLAAGLAVWQAAWPLANWGRAKIRAARTFSVRVPGYPGDALYEELHARILTAIPESKRQALVAGATDRNRPVMDDDGNFILQNKARAVRLRYDGSREQSITIGGHKVKIAVVDPMAATARSASGGGGYKAPEIVFTTTSWSRNTALEARDAVLAWIEDAFQQTRSGSRKPSFWMFNQWDEWERVEEVSDRSPDSVILPEGQTERIIADVQVFLDSEAEYVRRHVLWHRGYFFWGDPGTGKTSMARLIASHFGLDVWYLPLADVKRDASLLKSVHRIKGRSVLLLEDIDVFHAATSRVDENGKAVPRDDAGVTLAGVLNMLDGFGTPHGLIIIMTSNTPDVLDDAMMRTGRADRTEHFELAGPSEARRMLEWWYGEECPESFSDELRIPHSDIAEACKRSETITEAVKRLSSR